MSAFDLLGIAAGVIFVYLLLSLICTALYEIIESFLKNRAADLSRGIQQMLDEEYAAKLYQHPLLRALYEGKHVPGKRAKLPSYIPTRVFALALMDVVLPAGADRPSGAAGAVKQPRAAIPAKPAPDAAAGNPNAAAPAVGAAAPVGPAEPIVSLASLRHSVSLIENKRVKGALLPLIDAAGGDIGQARANIESWYDSAMDRVSAQYKRRSQQYILVLGLLLALVVNADTIAIVTSLARDMALRESIAAAAEVYVQSDTNAAAPVQGGEDLEACRQDASSAECRFQKHLAQLEDLGLPIGWSGQPGSPALPGGSASDLPRWLLKLLGWGITAVAISLGAPFWFDLLNKFIVIRSTVKPTEKSPEEKSED